VGAKSLTHISNNRSAALIEFMIENDVAEKALTACGRKFAV